MSSDTMEARRVRVARWSNTRANLKVLKAPPLINLILASIQLRKMLLSARPSTWESSSSRAVPRTLGTTTVVLHHESECLENLLNWNSLLLLSDRFKCKAPARDDFMSNIGMPCSSREESSWFNFEQMIFMLQREWGLSTRKAEKH